MNGERFDPLKIVQAFNHRGVEYVVIGGYAGELHAAAVPPTRDIDFTPRATAENLGRLSQVLTDLDARIRTQGVPEGLPFSHDAASLANAGIWNLTCKFGELDISFKPSGTDGYEDLVRTALRVDVRGEQMPVASLADIIRSKEAAGRPKDFTALPALQERLIAQRGTSLQEQVAAMARRAEERTISDQDGPRPGRPQRDVTARKIQADRRSAQYRTLRPPEQPGPSLGR
ncbi:MAG: hypothetical protein ACYDC9_13160 [Dermatophilaceae bacterium]